MINQSIKYFLPNSASQIQFRHMDNLLPEDEYYNKVVTYMQQTNQYSFDQAIEDLQRYHYDLQIAIAAKARENHIFQHNHEENIGDAANVKKYLDFLHNKKKKSIGIFGLMFYGIKWILGTVLGGIASLILPRALMIRIFYPKFYNIYYGQLQLPFQKNSLRQLLLNTKNLRRKSVLLAISAEKVNPNLVRLLNTPRIAQAVTMWFSFAGQVIGDTQLKPLGEDGKRVQLIVCRMNACQQIVVVQRFTQEQWGDITPEALKTCYENGVKQMQRDRLVVRMYKNYRTMINPTQIFFSSSEDEQQYQQQSQARAEIEAQNNLYRALEEKQHEMSRIRNLQQQKQIQQQKQLEEQSELRKIRMLSIPQQPKQGNIVRISFRCPNGSTIVRNFPTQQKIDLIYTWVQVNQQIQFENPSRAFEILFSYPLRTLSSEKSKQIGEVFEDQQQKVVIREL